MKYHLFRLPPLPSIRDIVKLYNVRAMKYLSQNFLFDAKLCSKIVRAQGKVKDCFVIEVGPGPGSLTRSVLEQNAKHVHVVEKDARFLPLLEQLQDASKGRLSMSHGDILSFNMEQVIPDIYKKDWNDIAPNVYIIGNLPFNISTPLIFHWLEDISYKHNAWMHGRIKMTLTFQLEVAQRIVAVPGHEQRSRLSIMCQNWCFVQHKFTIPGKSFLPKPKVNVGIVTFTPLKYPKILLNYKLIEKVVRCTFTFRQKFCRAGLSTLFPKAVREEMVLKLLTVADIDGTKRPFDLTHEEFNRLCHAYAAMIEENPNLSTYNDRGEDKEDINLEELFLEEKLC